jgi:hypothetical protein
MKHIYLITTITLFIFSILFSDTRVQFQINHKCDPGYSDSENQREHDKTKKFKQDKYSDLSVFFGIVMPDNSL